MRLSARLCKRLRGVARARSVGLPERRLLAVKPRNKLIGFPPNAVGVLMPVVVRVSQAVNDPQSTRGLYRAFKKAARAAGMLK